MKRFFDLFLVIITIPLWGPLLLVLALITRIILGKPVFFTQERPGRNGEIFYIIKLRSMIDTRDGHGELLPDEDRLPPFGKLLRSTSLDELPELINVLKGEMSLVGPRPLHVDYLPLYSKEQSRRHDVHPGITGWAQINGRNAITWEDKFEKDVWYVDNQSLMLDIKILWKTIFQVLFRHGISAPGDATMPRFTGSGKKKFSRDSFERE